MIYFALSLCWCRKNNFLEFFFHYYESITPNIYVHSFSVSECWILLAAYLFFLIPLNTYGKLTEIVSDVRGDGKRQKEECSLGYQGELSGSGSQGCRFLASRCHFKPSPNEERALSNCPWEMNWQCMLANSREASTAPNTRQFTWICNRSVFQQAKMGLPQKHRAHEHICFSQLWNLGTNYTCWNTNLLPVGKG